MAPLPTYDARSCRQHLSVIPTQKRISSDCIRLPLFYDVNLTDGRTKPPEDKPLGEPSANYSSHILVT